MRRYAMLLTSLAVLTFPLVLAAQDTPDVDDSAVAEVEATTPSAKVSDVAAPARPRAKDSTLGLTPEILDKLTPEQVSALFEEREVTRRAEIERKHSAVGPEVVAPIGIILMFVLMLFIPIYFRFRKDRHLHETLRAMIDKGVEIPVELIAPQRAKPRKASDLRTGLVLTTSGFGLALFLALLEHGPSGLWALGLIPMLMGGGYLIAWWLQRNENGEQTTPRD